MRAVGAGLRRCSTAANRFARDGFVVVPEAIPPSYAAELDLLSQELCARPENAELQRDQFTGSLIPVAQHERFGRLIGHSGTRAGFESVLGRGPGKWLSGFVISKPGGSPSLGWHQDGWYWDQPESYQPGPVQCFAMYYLTDTTEANGCLRVLPGSHTRHTALHDLLGKAHSEEVRSGGVTDWEAQAEHQAVEGTLNVPVQAGSLVIGDARLLHGACRNTTDQRRSLITLWYLPGYDECSPQFKQNVASLHLHQSSSVYEWSQAARCQIEDLLPGLYGMASGGDENLYDHNLGFMDRQPGHAISASPAARAAYERAKAA